MRGNEKSNSDSVAIKWTGSMIASLISPRGGSRRRACCSLSSPSLPIADDYVPIVEIRNEEDMWKLPRRIARWCDGGKGQYAAMYRFNYLEGEVKPSWRIEIKRRNTLKERNGPRYEIALFLGLDLSTASISLGGPIRCPRRIFNPVHPIRCLLRHVTSLGMIR